MVTRQQQQQQRQQQRQIGEGAVLSAAQQAPSAAPDAAAQHSNAAQQAPQQPQGGGWPHRNQGLQIRLQFDRPQPGTREHRPVSGRGSAQPEGVPSAAGEATRGGRVAAAAGDAAVQQREQATALPTAEQHLPSPAGAEAETDAREAGAAARLAAEGATAGQMTTIQDPAALPRPDGAPAEVLPGSPAAGEAAARQGGRADAEQPQAGAQQGLAQAAAPSERATG